MHATNIWPWLLLGWTAAELALVVLTHTRSGKAETHDRGSIFLLWAAIIGSITAAGWAHDALSAAGLDQFHWLRSLAILLFLVGVVIRAVAILSLGRSFTVNVAIQQSQTIYRQGLYRIVRHPSYLGLLLIFLAIGLHARNLVSFAIMLTVPSAALLYRIRVEEAALTHAFGPAYADYCRSTRRIIPGVF